MHVAPEIIALLIAVIAAVADVRRGIIPNWLTLPWLVAAPLLHFALFGAQAALWSVVGILVCAVVPLILRSASTDAMGGGDLKLFAAFGGLLGPGLGLEVQLASMLVLALYALGVLAFRGKLLRTLSNTLLIAVNLVRPQAKRRAVEPELLTSMRMGAAILTALVLVVAQRHVGLWP